MKIEKFTLCCPCVKAAVQHAFSRFPGAPLLSFGIILAASPEDIPEVSLSIAVFTQAKAFSYPSHQCIGSDLRLLEVIIHKHS